MHQLADHEIAHGDGDDQPLQAPPNEVIAAATGPGQGKPTEELVPGSLTEPEPSGSLIPHASDFPENCQQEGAPEIPGAADERAGDVASEKAVAPEKPCSPAPAETRDADAEAPEE